MSSAKDEDEGSDEVCSWYDPIATTANALKDMDDVLNVDFEWFDPQPEVDFHGLKTLMRQLFDADHELFELSALSNLILSQPFLGSTENKI